MTLRSAQAELALGMRQALAALARGDRKPPLGLYLFGSVARADETSASDVDVLLIARDATHRELLMDRLLAGVDTLRVQYGATASPVAYTIGVARRGWGECAAPWPDIARDVVPILGPPLSELLT